MNCDDPVVFGRRIMVDASDHSDMVDLHRVSIPNFKKYCQSHVVPWLTVCQPIKSFG